MKIYLIRHGQTTSDLEDRYGGWYDDHLSDLGKKQCSILSKKLAGKGIQMIFHSSLIRATETASILSKSINAPNSPAVPLIAVPDIREQNRYGILTGMKKSDAKKNHPADVLELAKGIDGNATGSEPYSEFRDRIISGMQEILKDSEKKGLETIAIITHGGPIKCIVRELLNVGELGEMADCGFLELEYKNNKLSVLSTTNLY